ncbi:hypothetical protein DLAC_04062 [Tieghemostelium lacteum]|uniref:Uncharacterized protein n=1 Tax=Tieghemostelium lacteum TaxID=361077 RepID=A0A151ZSK5_TIELA|nr:hypothetical protein DLAC_04062 [Tieghemostelium lacteum]|eukprot:KYQ96764.1 hypothetical protein DLAC_04062 [Tieghemostelium lacteum]
MTTNGFPVISDSFQVLSQKVNDNNSNQMFLSQLKKQSKDGLWNIKESIEKWLDSLIKEPKDRMSSLHSYSDLFIEIIKLFKPDMIIDRIYQDYILWLYDKENEFKKLFFIQLFKLYIEKEQESVNVYRFLDCTLNDKRLASFVIEFIPVLHKKYNIANASVLILLYQYAKEESSQYCNSIVTQYVNLYLSTKGIDKSTKLLEANCYFGSFRNDIPQNFDYAIIEMVEEGYYTPMLWDVYLPKLLNSLVIDVMDTMIINRLFIAISKLNIGQLKLKELLKTSLGDCDKTSNNRFLLVNLCYCITESKDSKIKDIIDSNEIQPILHNVFHSLINDAKNLTLDMEQHMNNCVMVIKYFISQWISIRSLEDIDNISILIKLMKRNQHKLLEGLLYIGDLEIAIDEMVDLLLDTTADDFKYYLLPYIVPRLKDQLQILDQIECIMLGENVHSVHNTYDVSLLESCIELSGRWNRPNLYTFSIRQLIKKLMNGYDNSSLAMDLFEKCYQLNPDFIFNEPNFTSGALVNNNFLQQSLLYSKIDMLIDIAIRALGHSNKSISFEIIANWHRLIGFVISPPATTNPQSLAIPGLLGTLFRFWDALLSDDRLKYLGCTLITQAMFEKLFVSPHILYNKDISEDLNSLRKLLPKIPSNIYSKYSSIPNNSQQLNINQFDLILTLTTNINSSVVEKALDHPKSFIRWVQNNPSILNEYRIMISLILDSPSHHKVRELMYKEYPSFFTQSTPKQSSTTTLYQLPNLLISKIFGLLVNERDQPIHYKILLSTISRKIFNIIQRLFIMNIESISDNQSHKNRILKSIKSRVNSSSLFCIFHGASPTRSDKIQQFLNYHTLLDNIISISIDGFIPTWVNLLRAGQIQHLNLKDVKLEKLDQTLSKLGSGLESMNIIQNSPSYPILFQFLSIKSTPNLKRLNLKKWNGQLDLGFFPEIDKLFNRERSNDFSFYIDINIGMISNTLIIPNVTTILGYVYTKKYAYFYPNVTRITLPNLFIGSITNIVDFIFLKRLSIKSSKYSEIFNLLQLNFKSLPNLEILDLLVTLQQSTSNTQNAYYTTSPPISKKQSRLPKFVKPAQSTGESIPHSSYTSSEFTSSSSTSTGLIKQTAIQSTGESIPPLSSLSPSTRTSIWVNLPEETGNINGMQRTIDIPNEDSSISEKLASFLSQIHQLSKIKIIDLSFIGQSIIPFIYQFYNDVDNAIVIHEVKNNHKRIWYLSNNNKSFIRI